MSGREPRRGIGPAGLSEPEPNAVVTGSHKAVWNHDFLNKKPWHPLNRQNQARIFEAEQEYLDRKKRDDAARAEFEAEQQYLETLAHLPSREADKYRQMQGVSWMYIKPPGLEGEQEYRTRNRDGASEARASQEQQRTTHASRQQAGPPSPEASGANTEAPALPQRRRGPLKPEERGQGTTRALAVRFQRRAASPPIGGTAIGADCHELVVEDPVDTDAMLAALLQRGERADSAEPSAGRSGAGRSAAVGADGSGERLHDNEERRSTGRKHKKRDREDKERRGERRGKNRADDLGDNDTREQSKLRERGRVGDAGDMGTGASRQAEMKRSRRGNSENDDGGSDLDNYPAKDKMEKYKSHKKSKHRSKERKHKSERRRSPRASGELQEALEYLIDQGVDVSQIVNEGRGYHACGLPCVCMSASGTCVPRAATTVPAAD